jgi:plasmid maintenance system antidote protein VapI
MAKTLHLQGITAREAAREYAAAWKFVQGKRNASKRRKRRKRRTRSYSDLPIGRWARYWLPWLADETPRAEEEISRLLGVTESTAANMIRGVNALSPRNALILADALEERFKGLQSFIDVLRKDADRATAAKITNLRRRS